MERGLDRLPDRGIIIFDPEVAALGGDDPRHLVELGTELAVEPLQFFDPGALPRVGAGKFLELLNLPPGQPPIAVINIAAALDVLVERKLAKPGLGARNAGVDRASEQGHVIGAALHRQRPVALLV